MQKVLYIFGELNDADLEWIIAMGQKVWLSAGDVLIRQGQPIDALYLVLDGLLSVRVEMSIHNGTQVAQLHSGDVVGEMSFLDERPPLATVISLGAAQVLSIPRDQLALKLQQDPGFAARFYRALAIFLSHRLRGVTGMLGYGQQSAPDAANPPQPANILASDSSDELEEALLDTVTLAGSRFERLLKRLASMP